ncbi:MAG: hypothetical protein HGA85_05470 [Nanoarchaeota archaeon]|nr:hypothetical protein [Nanoarchaeota archaeon]
MRLIQVADHVLVMTYPMVQDPKLLKLVLKNTYLAMQSTMASLLHYERYYKRVSPFTENYIAMLQLVRPVFEKYKISKGYVGFLTELYETNERQKRSDVEFVRKDKMVFASKDYDLCAVSVIELKDIVAKGKLFMNAVNGVIKEDERRNGKC